MEVVEVYSNSNSFGKRVLVFILTLTLMLEKCGLTYMSDQGNVIVGHVPGSLLNV